MKHLTMTYISLLVSIKTIAIVSSSELIGARSLSSYAPGQVDIRSIDARTVLSNERSSEQLLPRFGDNFATIHRRSGRGGGQSPPRDRAGSPDIDTATVKVVGKGPVRVSGVRDGGRKKTFPAVAPGVPFRADVDGHREAAVEVKTMENTRTGIKGIAVATPEGYQSAKLNINMQEGVGQIRRKNPQTQRFVQPFTNDEEEIIANPAPQKQELLGTMNGKGTMLATAKNPDTRGRR